MKLFFKIRKIMELPDGFNNIVLLGVGWQLGFKSLVCTKYRYLASDLSRIIFLYFTE